MQIAIDRSSPKTSRNATRTSRARPPAPPPVQRRTMTSARPPAEPARTALERAFGAELFAGAATGPSVGGGSGPDRAVNSTGIPSPVKAKMEAAFGTDFSGVRVHPRSSRATALGALAYTQGSEIHVAPGQWAPETRQGQELLGHELAHVVQQRAGRVQATAQYKGIALNDAPALEAEADAMGTRAAQGLSASPSRPVSSGVAHAGPSAPAQLKSNLKQVKSKKPVETPIETLHRVFKDYYKSKSMAPVFNFHSSLQNRQASQYGSGYAKAGEVVAEIDPASASKADSKNRDNTVINPYGHFGVMERAIFNRQDRGNTYDGGHLVEHTLMEGQDADVHGNIAPQESKHFNQGLMRGWEQIPEGLMNHDRQKFDYTVKVEYSNDTYERTGKQLVDAGVIPPLFFNSLPPKGTYSQDTLEKASATFVRWVPYRWTGKIDVGPGNSSKTRSLTYGQNLRTLQPNLAKAESTVVDKSGTAAYTATTGATLYRQYSGLLAGVIHGATLTPKQVLVVSSQTLEADMFQPEPQDTRDQPNGPLRGTSGSTAPAVLSSGPATTAVTANILKNPVDFYQMQQDLKGIGLLATSGKRKANSTIESEATKASSEYKKFKDELGNAGLTSNVEQRASFVSVFKSFNPTTHLTSADVTNIIDKAKFPAATRSRLHPIIYDPNLKL
ncbi:DUF4157 domain-containing protein [Sorangium sp. So ce134]